jgi:ribose transport system substrate-binding protein
MTIHTTRRTPGWAAAVLAAGFSLVACGSSSPTTTVAAPVSEAAVAPETAAESAPTAVTAPETQAGTVNATQPASTASTESTSVAATASACTNPKSTYKIGIAQWDLKEPYRAQARDDFRRLVKKYPQFELVEKDAQGKVDQQVSDVDALLAQKVDLIIIYPGDSLGLSGAVAKVHDAKVPIFEVDRSTPDDTKYDALLGGDNKAIATEQGKYLADNLPDGAEVAIITGDLASNAATERLEGAKAGLATKPSIKIVAEQTGEWRADKAQTAVDAILAANPKLAGIVYANDEMSLGGFLALKAVGKEAQVKAVGIDGLRGPANGVQEVIDGKLLATYEYPNGVPQSLAAAKQLLVDCKPVEKKTIIATRRIDSSNAAAVAAEGDKG